MSESRNLDRRSFLASVGILTVGAPILAACGATSGTSGSAGTPEQGGKLTLGMPSISPYLNPLTSTSSRVQWALAPVVESLYTYDQNLESVPLLAADEPKISEDGLTWTIKLNDGITFSNGDPLTAEHVAAVLTFVADPESVSDWTTFFAHYVKSAKAVDSSTVRIRLSTPYGVLRSHLTNLPIIHKDYVKKTDTTVGTGPFKIGEVKQGQRIDLTRFDGYHGTKSALDGVGFLAVSDPGTRLVNLRENKIQIMTDVPPSNVELLKRDSKIQTHVVGAPVDILTYFVADKPPFDNLKVRQAVAYAMDRKGVRDVAFAGTADIGQGPISPAEEGYDPNAAHYAASPDIDKAKALLAEAGVDNVEFTLMISNSSSEMKNVGQILVEGWKKAGIKVTLQALDTGAWVSKWVAGKYQLAMSLYQSGFGGGHTSFTVLGSYSSRNPLNFGYKNPKVDTLLGEAWATADAAKRAATCKRLDKLLADDAIGVPPAYPKLIVAQRKDITPIDEKPMKVSRIEIAPLQLLG